MLLVVRSSHHTSPTPLRVSLGTHTLLITSERHPTDPTKTLDTKGPKTKKPVVFNNEEAYKLCVCLETLFKEGQSNGGTTHEADTPAATS
jgi:hypothetical protein